MIRLRIICEPKNKYQDLIDVVVETKDGILEATDLPRSPICYSCRGAACGSCFVEISDPSLLEPPNGNELAVLHSMGADSENQRMACACQIKDNVSGTIRIRMAY